MREISKIAAVAQLVRASPCHGEGHRFESGQPRSMSTIDQPTLSPEPGLNYSRVEDLESLGWEIVGTKSVEAGQDVELLEYARLSTPETIYEKPIIAVGPDGRYYCMRKKKAKFAAFRKQQDR